MPTKSNNFQLEYFIPGSVYSSASDHRRFTTLDYNLESFIGIVGVGVISGWDLQNYGGLQVLITSGTGMINGYFAETPYSVKQRTQLTIGEIEKEVVRFDTVPEPYMTSQERNDYILVIQDYDPTFGTIANPCADPLENTYVKSIKYADIDPSRASILSLTDNADSYIYAEFPANWSPYPQLTDGVFYNVSNVEEPLESNYEDLDLYFSDYAVYLVAVEAYNAYKWQTYNVNHFTEVVFKAYSVKQNSNEKVLLGIVTTRNGSISAIDVSMVEDLENLNASIRKNAYDLIKKHIHGGDKSYDPPKIRLETDIREAFLNTYSPENGNGLFDIGEKYYTNITSAHKHSYVIDATGNGQTIEHFGDGVPHFHTITNYIVSQPLITYAPVDAHAHTITNNSNYVDGWTSENLFNVYANKKLIGDQDSSNISLDLTNKQIRINGGIGIQYKKYSCSFAAYGENYSFSKSDFSTYSFCVSMIADYSSRFSEDLKTSPELSPLSSAVINDPKSQDLILQSQAGDKALIKNDDVFVLTSPVANNIQIVVTRVSDLIPPFKITIEVLGNSEVTGIIGTENIVYIHADKFLSGQFSPARIPFISHIGRLGEQFSPYLLPMASKNGYKFDVLPYISDVSSGHYHSVSVDTKGDGSTANVMIGGDAVLYADGKDGTTYGIDHSHSISGYAISEVTADGINSWQATTGAHSHGFSRIAFGDNKTIYSIFEDADGNIWMGTSSGLIFKPATTAYVFNINGTIIPRVGIDLWQLLQEALSIYERQTGKEITVGDTYSTQIYAIQSALTSHGQSETISVPSSGDEINTTIMIQFAEFITLNDIYSYSLKKAYEIESDETITGVRLFKTDTGEEIQLSDPSLATYMASGLISVSYGAMKNISSLPYWNIFASKRLSADADSLCQTVSGEEIEDINVLGANIFASNTSVISDFSKSWTLVRLPQETEILKKSIYLRNGDVWSITNNGILVLKPGTNHTALEPISIPSTSNEINDLLEDGDGSILCATNNGIYRTSDFGASWTLEKESIYGFSSLSRDFAFDMTSYDSAHDHQLDVNIFGDGFTSLDSGHMHVVEKWIVQTESGHDHQITTVIYALENDGTIYFNPQGAGWVDYGVSEYEENGKSFAFNDVFFLATENGLCSFDGTEWLIVNSQVPYAFANSYDLNSMFVGFSNALFSSSDGTTMEEIYAFSGNPQINILSETTRKEFGYAICNKNSSVYFDKITANENYLALGTFDKWISEHGPWTTDNIDLYLDGNIVYSKSRDIDNLASLGGKIDKGNGLLDFSAKTELVEDAAVFDNTLTVVNSTDFNAGDTILVYNPGTRPVSEKAPKLTFPSNSSQTESDIISAYDAVISDLVSFQTSASENTQETIQYDNEYVFCTVSATTATSIQITSPLSVKIRAKCVVVKIPTLNAKSQLEVNIFESKISNAGSKSHNEIEDEMAVVISGMPKKMQNVYFSNILQLAQATRYVYPTITDYFKNSQFYDMHYSNDPLSTDLPYISDHIDVYNSIINSSSVFDSSFIPNTAKTVYCVMLGTGAFSGVIFVGTDIGLFWTKNSTSREENWVLAPNMDAPVYTMKSYLGTQIMIGTQLGVYVSEDLSTWTLVDTGVGGTPCHSIASRWDDKSQLVFQDVAIQFSNAQNYNDETKGKLTVPAPLIGLEPNRAIQIYQDNDIVGTFIVEFIDSLSDTEIWLKSVLSPVPDDGTYTVKMSYWWAEFDDEINLNQNLVNPIISAGQNNISIAINPAIPIWQSANIDNSIPAVNSDFIANNILPISSGSVLSLVTPIDENSGLAIIKSKDIGTTWENVKEFSYERGKILSASLTDDGHTKVTVAFEDETSDIAGGKRLRTAFIDGEPESQFSILWNETSEDGEVIYLYGTSPLEKTKKDMTLVVRPISINKLAEYNNTVYVGTNVGLWHDKQSSYGQAVVSGTVTAIGPSGKITAIGISGTIKAINVSASGNVVLLVAGLSDELYKDELKGTSININGVSETNSVIGNASTKSQTETEIEVQAPYSSYWINYIGREVTIFSSKTKIRLDKPITPSAFEGGMLYVVTNPYSEVSEAFPIVSNGNDYINISEFNKTTSKISTGNSVLLVNKDGKMNLSVVFDNEVLDMELAGLTLSPVNSSYSNHIDGDITINANEANKITLNKITLISSATQLVMNELPFLFSVGDKINIYGAVFTPVSSFAYNKTSLTDGHYHSLNMVGQELEATISSISALVNSVHYAVNISNVSGFDNPILSIDPALLKDETILFTNSLNPLVYFKKKVVEVASGYITVEMGSGDDWNLAGYNENLISETWNVTIDAKSYGFTDETVYSDFPCLSIKITDNISVGDTIITISSTADIVAGKKVKIVGTLNKTEENVVDSILDSTRISLSRAVSNEYFKSERAYINVLTDNYTNTHIHAIRKNKIESKNVPEYHSLGLALNHSHETEPNIRNVSSIVSSSGQIVIGGDSSKIYTSSTADSWNGNIDLNNSLEGGNKITGIQSMTLDNNGNIIAAANDMHLYFQNFSPITIEDMEAPTFD